MPPTIGPGQRALAAGDHHDHHRHRVDEGEHVGIDDPDIMRVETAGGARDRRPRSPRPASGSVVTSMPTETASDLVFHQRRAWRGRNANAPGAEIT